MQTACTASIKVVLNERKTFPESIPFEGEQYFGAALLFDL